MKLEYAGLVLLIIVTKIAFSQSPLDFQNVQIENLSINSDGVEFGPALVDQQLLYITNKNSEDDFFALYNITVNEKGHIKEYEVPSIFIQTDYHEGPLAFCEKTGELFITQSNIKNIDVKNTVFKKKQVRLGLVIYQKQNGIWEYKASFPFNSSEYSIAHPAINQTGDTLIFSSDMEGGYGGTDLYYSVKTDGMWGKPINMGRNINTPFSEITPFINSDKRLYFASNGHGGEGNLDLYFIENPFDSNSQIINLGKSVNTSLNDYSLVIHPNQLYAYMCSNRSEGKGHDDIYLLQAIPQKINYSFIDFYSKNIIPKVNMKIAHNGELKEELLSDTQGNILVNYDFNIDYNLSFEHNDYFAQQDTIKSTAFISFPFYQKQVTLKPYPILYVTVVNEENNQAINNVELVIKSKNQTRVLTTNEAGSCNTKIKHIETYVLAVNHDGFLSLEQEVEITDFDQKEINDSLKLTPIYEGKTFTLENLYYDLNSSAIRPDAAEVLDGLLQILVENPSMKIELSAHTDCRESETYNLWLSKARAQSAINYLIEKGIESDRLMAKGYGKTKPIIECPNCLDCTEEQHQQNRRTEIKILEN